MEYRGYDSAGLVVADAKGPLLFRAKGRVSALQEKINGRDFPQHLGIAHTRWATHGEPSEKNAHPHADCKGEIFVVHNGIIENFAELKEQLIKEGHKFASDTDTEVIPHLIEQFYPPFSPPLTKGGSVGGLSPRSYKGTAGQSSDAFAQAVRAALQKLTGAFGIAAFSSKHPDTFVAARLGSPLVVGLGEGEYIVASDLTAVLPITQKVIYLEDGEMGVFRKDGFTVTDFYNRPKAKNSQQVDWTLEAAELQGFPHFMLKEIFEQPEAVTNSIRGRLLPKEGTVKLGGLQDVEKELRKIERLVIIAMGTARNAGLVGEYMLEEYAGLPVEVEFASEFAYRKSPLSPATSVIAISQSGETADTLIALREAKRKGLLTLGIVNVTGSTAARETDAGVYNHIGPEIAVASTKAFVSQITILALLTIFLGRMREMSVATGQRVIKEISTLPALVDQILDTAESIKHIAEKYKSYEDFFFLGRKYNYPTALEGALKLKEIAYVHAEGYNGGEMKHGPIALIDEHLPVVVIAPSDSVYEKNLSHIQELKVRDAKIIAVATAGNEEIGKLADDVIYIPKTLEMLTPILAVIPLQLLAYYIAVARGCDVDKPRNLAKSVTVE